VREELGKVYGEATRSTAPSHSVNLHLPRVRKHDPRLHRSSAHIRGRLLPKLGECVCRRDDLYAQLWSSRERGFLWMSIKVLLRTPRDIRRAHANCRRDAYFHHHVPTQCLAKQVCDMRCAQPVRFAARAHQDLPPFCELNLGGEIFEARIGAQSSPALAQLLTIERCIDDFVRKDHPARSSSFVLVEFGVLLFGAAV